MKIINCKITMKEIDPIAGIDTTVGIDHKIIMKKIGHTAGIDHTVETDHRISMIVIDPMIQMIHIAEIGHMTETDHTKEIGHIVEIDCEATTTKMTIEMSIREKIIGISETRGIKEIRVS